MVATVFYSWQADRETTGGRNLIQQALEQACERISADTSVEEVDRSGKVKVDHDTKGVPGHAPIVDTIFRKIDNAAVFVPDLTFVGIRADHRPTPNPNVLVEYGWSLKSLKYNRIVPVMNVAYGEPVGEAMPFDMRHLRYPITYNCPASLDAKSRRQVRDKLAKELEAAIRLVLQSPEYLATLPQPPIPAKFVPRQPVDGAGRFKPIGTPVGAVNNRFRGTTTRVFVPDGPVRWFRLMPSVSPDRSWSVDELEKAMQTPSFVAPLGATVGGFEFLRSHEGFGTYAVFSQTPDQAQLLVFAFTNGEIWSADTYSLAAYRDEQGRPTIPTDEVAFRHALVNYADFLSRLGITPPYQWEAGMENLTGRALYVPAPHGHMRFRSGPDGECLENTISASGKFSPGDPVGLALKPFFEKLYNACAIPREAWQDEG
jgi:hypothetical protein